tara:strand:- start:4446 stop:4778 length:333 start_codon:yes stop_codon:yes gene_type:complete
MVLAFRQQKLLGWVTFFATVLAGLVFAFLVFALLAMGECLPRDDSISMHACDAIKQREFWLYPALVTTLLGIAAWLQNSGQRVGHAIALTCGFTGVMMLWMIEALVDWSI